MELSCGNCGRPGHNFHQCKMPIISLGVVGFRIVSNRFEFLMIRRKDTLGFMDFMRGKYSIYNKEYILQLLNEMTIQEKACLLKCEFNELWSQLWCNQSAQYRHEEQMSREKFEAIKAGIMSQSMSYTLEELVAESNEVSKWTEAEWGFPKGRRNYNEKDVDCALREFAEETGYKGGSIIENIQPFEEIFMGSNYKSYKHKYYLMKVEDQDGISFDKTEVSKIEWKSYEECLASIRGYNLEKKNVIEDIYKCLTMYSFTNK